MGLIFKIEGSDIQILVKQFILRCSEYQARIAQERILFVEKHFSELCSVFGSYTRKVASVRDANDDLAKTFQSLSKNENINKTLKQSLEEFSSTLAEVGNYRNIEVERLDKKVVQEFVQYETVCRNAKEEVKHIFTARDHELTWRKQLEKIKEKNPLNKQQITTAESELVKATAEVSRTQRALEDQMDLFEKKKLHDIKTLLTDFVKIEIALNAKLIELFTRGYQELMQVDEDEDLEDFQKVRSLSNMDFQNEMKVPESASRLETVKKTSLRNTSLLASLFSTRKLNKNDSTGNISSQTTISSTDLVETLKNNGGGSDTDGDDDDEDENEEDEEDDSSLVSEDNISVEPSKKLYIQK
ncbi:CBY1 interacting BAR domain containing protein Fam92 [Lycorma delicatula]|uniref:CBY1 interacting BAR domain containing protein Fam92 n=1 Tax=Lycorma delicatula TaxID=130591 RepID=UPI003F517B2D